MCSPFTLRFICAPFALCAHSQFTGYKRSPNSIQRALTIHSEYAHHLLSVCSAITHRSSGKVETFKYKTLNQTSLRVPTSISKELFISLIKLMISCFDENTKLNIILKWPWPFRPVNSNQYSQYFDDYFQCHQTISTTRVTAWLQRSTAWTMRRICCQQETLSPC